MIISIDGPAGSGKSTVAELLSQKLGFVHFNSGAIFRGITAYLMSINFDFSTIKADSVLKDFVLKTEFVNGIQHVYVNNIDFTSKLRNNEVSVLTPIISTCKFIRNKIDNFQREFASHNDIVVDGRDVGSHVFPNADFKFYLDCSLEERANRRHKEELGKGSSITLEEIKQQIATRDKFDKEREIAPLVIPEGAIIVDSTNLNINQVVDTLYSKITL